MRRLLERSPEKRLGTTAADIDRTDGDGRRGVDQIKEHAWFKGEGTEPALWWYRLERGSIPPRYIPSVASQDDTSNFIDYEKDDESPVDKRPLSAEEQALFVGF